MALHFECCPSLLDEEQILDYLHTCKSEHKTPSESFFKHTVYGLRALYKVLDRDDIRVCLPSIERPKKLPVVLSQQEMKRLVCSPKLLKHRLIIGLLYGCGLRRSELLTLELQDIDLDRGVIHIRQSKNRKDRYVPVGQLLQKGLGKYMTLERPEQWLFYRKDAEGKLHPYSESGVQWVIRTHVKHCGFKKKVTAHTLRHSYATHLLEQGMDIVSLKELLGHERIETTLVYLHVSQLGRHSVFSPLDKIYDLI